MHEMQFRKYQFLSRIGLKSLLSIGLVVVITACEDKSKTVQIPDSATDKSTNCAN